MPRLSCTFTLCEGRRLRRPYEGSFFCRGEACLASLAHSRCVKSDACVAPTKVPSSVGARRASPLFAHSRCVKGDACVAATKLLSSNPALLLRLEAGVLDHLAPLAELDLDEIPELLGRA